jgi:hypothetical protein
LARLQYVVFLLQKEVGLGGFWFEPRRFGPWSMELEGALAALEREGLLSVRLEEPGPADAFGERPLRVYAASQALVERSGEEFEKLVKRDQFKAYLARRLVAIGIAIPPPRLLTYIYLKYTEAVPHAERERYTYGDGCMGLSPSVKQILDQIDSAAEALENKLNCNVLLLAFHNYAYIQAM